MWLCQFIDWLKFETCPSSLPNFGMAYRYSFESFAGRVSKAHEQKMRCTCKIESNYLFPIILVFILSKKTATQNEELIMISQLGVQCQKNDKETQLTNQIKSHRKYPKRTNKLTATVLGSQIKFQFQN